MLNINPLGGTQYYSHYNIELNFDLFYGSINESDPPFVKEDDYFILVCTRNDNKTKCIAFYVISLFEPKYLHNSDALPEDIRDAVIKTIYNTYIEGIKAINKNRRLTVFNIPETIPDYNPLKYADKYANVSDAYLDSIFRRRSAEIILESVIDSSENLYWYYVQHDYFNIVIIYGCIDATNTTAHPKTDDFYIMVWITDDSYNIKCYRISLTEPKYVYGSEPLPEIYKDTVVKGIRESYKSGVTAVNDRLDNTIPTSKKRIPNYNLL